MIALVKSTATVAAFLGGSWELGVVRGSQLLIGGQQVVGPRRPAIAGPSGGTIIDGEARAAIGEILSAMRQHGLIAT